MSTEDTLPLFPLGKPLFPGIPLKLQIFEQRYLRLVKESMRSQKPFGIVPILSGHEVGKVPEIFMWGTAVIIRDWDQLDNGLLGITVQGERRFNVEGITTEDDGLLIASATLFDPDPLEPLHEDDLDLLRLLNDLSGELKLSSLTADESISVSELGWRLLMLFPFDEKWQLSMLQVDDPETRLQAIRDHITRLSSQ